MVFWLASWAPSMPMNSITSLLDALERTELFSPEQIAEVESELVPLFDDPAALVDYLVQIEWLTEYQAEALFAQEWDRLVRGPYQILDLLGEGAISEVFRAWDTVAGRVVALKVLRPEMAERADAVEQLRHEIRVMMQMAHPNVIRTFGVSADEESPYLAMEYVQGMDLERLVQQEGPLSVEQACDYIRQAAQGLQHAHQLGLVHRDIKPANLILVKPTATTNGVVRSRAGEPVIPILDWGLAHTPTPAEAGEKTAQGKPGSGVGGHLLGTPDYVAPEQAQDPAGADIRADVYSLGCTLYFLLTGKPPFPGPSLMQKLMQHRTQEPQPIQELRPEVPDDLAAVLRRMMAKQPQERFPIPLLLVAPLRRFSLGAAAAPGPLGRPGSSAGIRPASSASLGNARPPSFLGIGTRSDSNGQAR